MPHFDWLTYFYGQVLTPQHLQRAEAPRAPDDAAVQADVHKFGCVFAFGVQHIKTIF